MTVGRQIDSGVQMPEQINDSRGALHHYRIRLIVFHQNQSRLMAGLVFCTRKYVIGLRIKFIAMRKLFNLLNGLYSLCNFNRLIRIYNSCGSTKG
jgi:hypothetical protein